MGFCIANDINNTQMITMKICAKGSKMFRIYKLCDFPIIIPRNKYFCVPVNIARYKNGTRERGSLELKN